MLSATNSLLAKRGRRTLHVCSLFLIRRARSSEILFTISTLKGLRWVTVVMTAFTIELKELVRSLYLDPPKNFDVAMSSAKEYLLFSEALYSPK